MFFFFYNFVIIIMESDRMSKKLEQTTRIRIDMDRINDSESLDTSFLEGKAKRKIDKNNNLKKEILNNKKHSSIISIIGKVFLFLIFLVLLLFLFYILMHNSDFKDSFLKSF